MSAMTTTFAIFSLSTVNCIGEKAYRVADGWYLFTC